MTVSNQNYTKTVTLATGTDAVSTLIHVLDATHMACERVRAGIPTTLTNGVDFNITDVGVSGGCTATMVGQASGDIVTLTRAIPFEQAGDYVSGFVFPPETNEYGHDQAMMLFQQLQEQIDRCVKFPVADSGTDKGQEIPSTVLRSGAGWGFDDNGLLQVGSDWGSSMAAFGSVSSDSVAVAASVNIVDVAVALDQTALLTVYTAIEGRSYAILQKFLLINDAAALALEAGWVEEYAANAIGGEAVAVTCAVNGTNFRVTIDGTDLTDTRTVKTRWKIETFTNNGDIGYTPL